MKFKDYYKILELKTNKVSSEEIKNAYRLAVKKNHPDLFVFQNATAPDLARKTLEYAPLIDLFGLNEYEAAGSIIFS